MKIKYDRNIPLGTLSPTPWAGTNLQKWFDQYCVVALHGWGGPIIDGPRVAMLPEHMMRGKFLLGDALAMPEFKQLLRQALPPCNLLTWHIDELPDDLQQAGYQARPRNPHASQQFENKTFLRKRLGHLLPFPAFTIHTFSELRPDFATYQTLLAGRESFVLQHDASSGGRGTFIVRDFENFIEAMRFLQQAQPQEVIASEHVEQARERSVQCCISEQGVFVGPLQKQIVGDSQLANLNEVERPKFVGGEISPYDLLLALYPTIKKCAETIGMFMREQGYRGIMGIDFLVGSEGQVYVLEINPRFTGLTPLLVHLWRDERDFPSYLLHILEYCNIPYEVLNDSSDVSAEGGMLQLHSQVPYEWHIADRLRPGVYRWHESTKEARFVGPFSRLDALPDASHFLVETTYPHEFPIRPGRRLMKLFFGASVLDDQDVLLPEKRDIVAAMYELALPKKANL